jgi:ribonuclease T1
VSRRNVAALAVCALIVIAAGWVLLRPQATSPPAPTPPTSTGGLPSCALTTLPAQAADTVRVIRAGGPFPFPRNDGVVFGNREGHLPGQQRGYYHEYTVPTPGAHNRATRRIITGGAPLTHPLQYFYTADHYDSFCVVTGAGGQR